MPQLVKKRRSGWAVLAVGALVASLLAVGSAPAGAAAIETGDDNEAEPSVKPTFSACVGDATDDHGFTDLGTLDAAAQDINCLAYYGITTGTTAETFDPNSNVTRSQMALFLSRAAGVMGVGLMGGDMPADFNDIAELGESRQNAITSLARNGILAGRGDMTFDPLSDITRAEMAAALVNLLRKANSSLFNQDGSLDVDADDLDHFADSRATVPAPVDTAISYAYELGITTGRADATFGPNDGVPRRNMASFIVRTMAHTNTRPAGLSVQSDNGTITISVRAANFAPVTNMLVDAFYIDDARVGRAFRSDGSCHSLVTAVEAGSAECEIDYASSATNSDGNAALAALGSAQVGTGITVWAWMGDVDDEVSSSTDLVEFPLAPVTSQAVPDAVEVTPSQDRTPNARLNSTFNYVVQLKGTLDGDAVDAVPGPGGATYLLTVTEYNHEFASLSDSDRGTLVRQERARPLKLDSAGQATFSVSADDPAPAATSSDDERTVVYKLDASDGAPAGTSAEGYVTFVEETPVVTTLTVESARDYVEAPASGNSGTSVVVTAIDQYGNPVPRVAITAASSETMSSLPETSRSTDSTGAVRISYSYSAGAQVETITATWDAGPGADPDDTSDDPPDVVGTGTVNWYTRIANTGTNNEADNGTDQAVVTADTDANEIIVDAAAPKLVAYDDNDQFRIDGDEAADDTEVPTNMEAFERQLNKVLAEGSGLAATLSWTSYNAEDDEDTAVWTLKVDPA